MFLIEVTLKKAQHVVIYHLPEHNQFLDRQHSAGNLMVSGRKRSKYGGEMILANLKTMAEVESMLSEDPFHKNEVADYRITEFTPTMYDERLQSLIRPNKVQMG